MENASKALIMVASILIGVMIIAFMVYMFSDASKLNKRQEAIEDEKQISAFNARFQDYETLDDGLIDPATGNLYKTAANKQYAIFNASKGLNKISDVITVVNEAYDINYKNSNEYKINDYIEYINGIVIVLDLKADGVIQNIVGSGIHSKRYYVIFPNKKIESGYLYGMNEAQYNTLMQKIKDKVKNIDISGYQKVEVSKFLEYFRESRVATSADNPPDNRNYILFKYYFSGKLNINSTTSKIDKVTFTLVKDELY